MRIGDIEIKGKLALAPLAGVSDLPFRTICRELGAALCYTEMVSAKALCYQDGKTKTLLMTEKGDRPLGVQIFGSDPACMGEGAAKAVEISGADFVDINMGCPVGKIVKSGDGSALMRTPELAREIIETVKRNVKVPVTVKIRKGWDGGSVNAVEFAQMAEAAGASMIAVHGRTRVQMYNGRADWDIIRAVKGAVKVPVIANGDIWEPKDAVRILEWTGADMGLVARGSFGNPWLFQRANALLNGELLPPEPTLRERMRVALRQIEMALEQKGEKVGCFEARKHMAWYLHGVPHAGKMREAVNTIAVKGDIYRVAEEIVRHAD
ncbi:MAG: tRNA dihydrouridine synthase DusB [Oscillospiraceae bacterium]|nr:tRNA dihydrouridine synthase DusB [Oscillospiraceae bacterium]